MTCAVHPGAGAQSNICVWGMSEDEVSLCSSCCDEGGRGGFVSGGRGPHSVVGGAVCSNIATVLSEKLNIRVRDSKRDVN